MIRDHVHRYKCCDVLLQLSGLDPMKRDLLWRDAVSSQQGESYAPLDPHAQQVDRKLDAGSRAFLRLAAAVWWARDDKALDKLPGDLLEGIPPESQPMAEVLLAAARSDVDADEVDRWLEEHGQD